MLKGRGRDTRVALSTPARPAQAHLTARPPSAQAHRAPLAKPEPDYEVVEFPSEQYVNAKLQPPPAPPPRPPTGHPAEAGASCGLCGGGGARVRCAECGRRALCASCDDMYHRHPKRRHHQRQALSPNQLRDERPPLPPKSTAPVPPPRRHKITGERSSASPMPPGLDQRRATLGHLSTMPHHQPPMTHQAASQRHIPAHLQSKLSAHLGSMPYLPTNAHHAAAPVPAAQQQVLSNTMGHLTAAWGRQQRGSLQGFNVPQNQVQAMPVESWEGPESISPSGHMSPSGQMSPWGRPLRRGVSVLELGAVPAAGSCAGCAHCAPAPAPWRYGSCASLEHAWPGAWPPPPACCAPAQLAQHAHLHPHSHLHLPPHTPQPYRRVESRAASRAASRAGASSRAASPAGSVRSRASRRARHRSPSPPALPSSDADSESESESEPGRRAPAAAGERPLGPAPPPPAAAWQCEHCTFLNEGGVRVCAVCCRTPTAAPRVVSPDVAGAMQRLKLADRRSPSPSPVRAATDELQHNGRRPKSRTGKERTSTGCGPSPPREEHPRKPMTRLATPSSEQSDGERARTRGRREAGVGPSPPRDSRAAGVGPSPPRDSRTAGVGPSPPRDAHTSVRASPRRQPEASPPREPPARHSVSVGPSPPRDATLRPSVGTAYTDSAINTQRKSTATSPPRETATESRSSSASARANVSNTGTSPPPQSISTQTYEVPNSWERAPSASRSRPRRRFRDESRRERSHSRHSLSSDTRESERSARTSGGGRWEWRETRDSSPGGEWSGSERRRAARLTRRASHLDLHRARPARRASFYGSEAASPEPLSSNRAMSLEALAGAGARRETERGLELARLMSEAERLGFSAAEVHAALAQNPAAPLSWLRERWPSLCAGVRAAAARLAPGAAVSEREARAALARHRGAMWPAVTDCVERHRRQTEVVVGEEGRLRGHVWGSPAGADDEAAPPARAAVRRPQATRAEDSSDEFEAPTSNKFQDDDWMYLPLEPSVQNSYEIEANPDIWIKPSNETFTKDDRTEDIAQKLKTFLLQAGIPSIDENLLLKGLLADNTIFKSGKENISYISNDRSLQDKPNPFDFVQSENDFIDAYNALTRSSPLPSINNPSDHSQTAKDNIIIPTKSQQEPNFVKVNDTQVENGTKMAINDTNNFQTMHSQIQSTLEDNSRIQTPEIREPNKSKKDNTVVKMISEPYIETSNNKVQSPPRQVQVQVQAPNEDRSASEIPIEPKVINVHKRKSPDPIIKTINHYSNTKNLPFKDNVSPEYEGNRQLDEERTNNLSDIVDNTQRLIQQMKEEINSDINSLDGNNMSQSEADNSSNDSDLSTEHESSYSESEQETDDLTSDDNENSSAGEDNVRSEKSSTVINRTSSEENEQFEEAMDHIEEQNESFKQTNIEILDSIARSLQEEHTISVEMSPTKGVVATQTKVKAKNQDVNNNLFASVNTFEEIYEQLNSTNINRIVINEQPKSTKIQNTKESVPSVLSNVAKTNINLKKREINIAFFKLESPIKLIVTENQQKILNAVVETIEPIIVEENILDNTTNKDSVIEIEPVTLNQSTSNQDDLSLNNRQITLNEETISDRDNDNTHSDTPINNVSQKENTHDLQNLSKVSNENLHNYNEDNNTETDISSVIKNNALSEEMNTDRVAQVNQINVKAKSKSPETNYSNPKNGNNNSTIASMIKSNIPKLIRILPNKQKNDKITTKIIASKVPVRQASLKQYHAPAPPKTHFGNIQSGHVKKLQTRLFDNRSLKGNTPEAPAPATVEVKATTSTSSTSTLNKKRPAPPPPSKLQENKEPTPPKTSPPRDKKSNYFRETCRTEDEWTDSDSEDSQLQIFKLTEEEPQRAPPSPPPPVTVRRVSGQLVDLATIRLLEGSPERQARMLLAEGATESWEQAQVAVELVARGAEPPAALLAALECADLASALAYLHQDCELCASRLPEHEMVSMLRCTHRCCRECARHYFTVQISERSIADCVCPYCKEPDLEALPEDEWLEYFAHLDILLKTLLDVDLHELFQRKLRDRTLARDPNFRWCVECSSGFFVHPKQKKLRCPECKSVSCAACRKPWSANHEGVSCEQYAAWLEDNDPERSVAAVQQHLRENGLECPRCHFKYSLSRGGCMHFTCTQCKYEFCYGCGKPFMMGARCGLSEYCAKLGLHAHHPRNCLFYLRDKEPHELQTLLQMNNVSYEREAAEGCTGRCPIQLQRETPAGLVDGACGGDVPPGHAGLCKNHYLEYLSRLARARRVDPLPLLGVDDLETLVRRAALRLPPRPYGTLEGLYKRALVEIVKEKIPLD